MPKLPKFPPEGFPPKVSGIIKKANPLRVVIEDAREVIRSGREEIGGVASALRVEGIREPETTPKQEAVATACVPCALGHFSTSAGLLNEAVRFKGEGISSNEILDRISKCLQEQNALERVDLAPEMIQNTPPWERGLAEEALNQSRALRHRLESIETIDELEKVAADTTGYYRKLNREWYKGRFAHLGKERVEAIESKISPEDKERIKKRAEELIEEV